MRREDKNKLPPRLKLTLPQGYSVERSVEGYQLYYSFPWGPGTMTRIVAGFTKDTTPGVIEDYAREHLLHAGV